MATSQNLEGMKLIELKELAKQMGLRGTSTMRKPELVATLQAARSGGEAPAGVTVRPVKGAASKPTQQTQPAAQAAQTPEQALKAEPKGSAPVSAADDAVAGLVASLPEPDAASTRTPRISRQKAAESDSKDDRAAAPRRRTRDDAKAGQVAADLFDELDIAPADDQPRHRDDAADSGMMRRRRRAIEPRERDQQNDTVRDLDDILATLPVQNANADAARGTRDDRDNRDDDEREFTRRNRSDRADRSDRNDRADRGDRGGDRNDRGDRGNDRRQRRMRGRDRGGRDYDDRDTREVRISDHQDNGGDDLVPVAGIVDVLDSYAFVRTSGYLPGPNDVYISMGQVKKYGLRKGDAVTGSIRAPREGDRRNQRQKFVPLQSVDTINGMSVEEAANRPQFAKLTPLYPQERLKQETTPNKLTGRIMDIVSPIGKGQRGLIVSPPKAGKTITLQNIANAITTNNPEVHLMVVLVDERPEEVTDMERTVAGEVISSTFDRLASDHTTVAELAIERAKRLVELGQDVVVLLDSMTRLARAYNIAAPASGRILSGGVDAQALYPPKKFFGAARNIENGGSLTIISSALVETGSKMDEVIFEEFKGTGNMELRLSRELADKRLFPAIDVNASGTRREELITSPQELPIIYRLRRLLGGMEPEQAYQTLVPRLKKTATNRDFLAAIIQQSNSNPVNGN
ncbi:transcription termination factor Rho [Bifidobacterium bifidum]|uniref:transcription termination factor Rho n=1 Tax=Bifidobacterium bifidum TaxID=1681 RepID=UPI00232F018C|nr:transcription termination factor Rho [Bifidobacterium bifidum]MDB1216665.1 transcription termination factor Rho [Bifidobacterium bifidum]MDB1219592.1 transcription termination factor Rho [Bifidobacterium bifidum]MDB1223068.1 transcription termination factor Rho [Bifidobacterium bifidum]MDB1225320.1 transcription termination factor Rho [Bifidobacterium bifidum]